MFYHWNWILRDAAACGYFPYFQPVLIWHCRLTKKMFAASTEKFCRSGRKMKTSANKHFLFSSHGNWFAFEFFLFKFSASAINVKGKLLIKVSARRRRPHHLPWLHIWFGFARQIKITKRKQVTKESTEIWINTLQANEIKLNISLFLFHRLPVLSEEIVSYLPFLRSCLSLFWEENGERTNLFVFLRHQSESFFKPSAWV